MSPIIIHHQICESQSAFPEALRGILVAILVFAIIIVTLLIVIKNNE